MSIEYALFVRTTNAWEFALCALMFAFIFPRKKKFLMRLGLGFVGYTLLAAATAPLQMIFNGFWMHLLITALVYTGTAQWIIMCWNISLADWSMCLCAGTAVQAITRYSTLSRLLLLLCAGTAVQAITGRLAELFYLVQGVDPYRSISLMGWQSYSPEIAWLVYLLLHLILIITLGIVFRGKKGVVQNEHYSRIVVLFSISVMAITTVLQNYSRPLEANNPEMASVVRALALIWSLLVLIFRTVLLAHGHVNKELEITQRLLQNERKQFDAIRDDMEMINIKCHDMRHMLDQYADRLTENEMKKLRSAIRIYDSHLKTGNDILNMVLYKKQAIMEQRHITLSCMADARCLSFMEASDVFSMMNNAIDNAIEAVSQLTDEAMRLISLNIREENGVAVIQLTNYFVPGSPAGSGLPQTTKDDYLKHGYGMRSIDFVAQKYDGLMRYQTEDNLFHLNVCIPIVEKG